MWPQLTGADLARSVKTAKGTAPGLDQWTISELKMLSLDMWDTVADFVAHCETLGKIPLQWKQMKQRLHLSKGKNSDLVGDLRPISITSLWWRTLQRARFQQDAAQQWIQQTMPPYVFGGVPRKGTTDAIGPLLLADAKHWYIGSLDYQKAFDRVHPSLVCDLFAHFGMPAPVATLMRECWTDQRLLAIPFAD